MTKCCKQFDQKKSMLQDDWSIERIVMFDFDDIIEHVIQKK